MQPASELDPEQLPDGVHRLRQAGRVVFAKIRRHVPADFFAAEARGLRALAAAGALRVPQVYAAMECGIVIEDLGSGRPSRRDWELGGRALAGLHRHRSERFGFEAGGYCGDTPQANPWRAHGAEFFAEARLLPQARLAFDHGRLDQRELRGVEALCTRLGDLLPPAPAVLIHGDLWTGNLHACANGELALIDGGAVHYGWADCDLAMLTLFGEPPHAFFAAYEDEARIDSDWRKRAPLLNLYHLINHLNLFGAGYLRAVQSVLANYA